MKWDEQGLVPAIAQDAQSGDVLMFAWMNREALERTAEGGRMTLNICFNYSGRAEIVDAARALIAGRIAPSALTDEAFAAHLYTNGQPDVDLIIRTGGERRTSNFLLWQLSLIHI